MPTTSSPWASPSSPAGRRLLLAEPPTADDIPVLDPATFARLGQAASASPGALPSPSTHPAPAPSGLRPTPRTQRPRRSLVAAALVVAVLALGLGTGQGRPDAAPVASPTTPATPGALAQAAGAMAADVPPPVAGGAVAVGLIDPTETMRATPLTGRTLAERLGTLVALAAEEPPAP